MTRLFLLAAALLHCAQAHSISHLNVMAPRAPLSGLQRAGRNIQAKTSKTLSGSLVASLHDSSNSGAAFSAPAPAESGSSLGSLVAAENVKLALYLAVWYLGNIYYNLYNKYASNALGKDAHGHSNAHWILSAVQVRCCAIRYVTIAYNRCPPNVCLSVSRSCSWACCSWPRSGC